MLDSELAALKLLSSIHKQLRVTSRPTRLELTVGGWNEGSPNLDTVTIWGRVISGPRSEWYWDTDSPPFEKGSVLAVIEDRHGELWFYTYREWLTADRKSRWEVSLKRRVRIGPLIEKDLGGRRRTRAGKRTGRR